MSASERPPIRVLVIDDHDVVQWGFRLLLDRQRWVESCAAAHSGAEAVELCRSGRIDVALVDMLLGDESGAEVCEEIRSVSPPTRVLLISGAGIVSPAVARAAGASGFISKDWSAVDVVKAVRMVSLGTEVFADQESGGPVLSEREQEVLALVAAGSTNREIADRLHLSPHTVKEYTSAIYRKLGVRNRTEATRRAQRLKLLV